MLVKTEKCNQASLMLAALQFEIISGPEVGLGQDNTFTKQIIISSQEALTE